jgi:hypothetical protein
MSYSITQDDYFKKQQPAKYEELVNYIEITTQPLKLATTIEEVYKSKDVITLNPSATDTVEVLYSKPPVKNAVITITESDSVNVTITDVEYYPFGAYVEVHNSGGTVAHFKLVSNGYPLEVSGQQIIVKKDDASILENGLLKYSYKNNHLIQSASIATKIAERLLASYKIYRKDVSLEWRGNPALVLGDTIRVPEYKKNGLDIQADFVVYKNQLEYNGTLRARTEGRKVV